MCWDGDGGGGRFIAEFAIINNKDRKITLHPFLIYEGTYVRSNLEVTLGRLTRQFIELEGATILVDGKTLKITQFGVFDLCALNCIIGKQNHSSTYFGAWTNCTTQHIRTHSGKIHTPSACGKNISFLSLKDIENHLTHHSLDSLPQRKTGNLHGNVVGENLLQLKNIFRYIPSLMHIIMGLGNDVLNELKKTVINLDNDESDNDVIKFNVTEDIKKLYCEKELLSIRHGNNNLDKYVAENDLERLPYLLSNSEKEAEKVAKKRYSKSKTKAKKTIAVQVFVLYLHVLKKMDLLML